MKFVLLWTDGLAWALVAACIAFAWIVHRHEHLLAPWRRVAHSATAMASVPVLCVFLLIGLADSIHYRLALEQVDKAAPARYAVEVQSVLDALLDQLRTARERTYSAPLAIHAYQKESIDQADGSTVRDYPSLLYAGLHLHSEAERTTDLVVRALSGAVIGLLIWGAIWLGTRARKAEQSREQSPERTDAAWLSLAIILIGGAMIASCASGYHVFGTDRVGQDVLYLALKSIRTALVIGTLTTFVMLPFSLGLGIAAGYCKGWIDDGVQFIYTTLNSIPSVLLIAAAVLLMQVFIDTHPELFQTLAERADLRLLFLCIILGLTSWTGLARLLRAEALKLRELDYVLAARALGVSSLRIMSSHVARNSMHLVVITLVTEFSSLVLAEAVLSYIGVGVDPSMNSFGTMINAARLELSREPPVWWSLAAAFSFMFILVLAANLLADAVRDAFDPRTATARIAPAATQSGARR